MLSSAYDAFQRRDGHALASLMHPDALEAYRRSWISNVLGWAEETHGGAEPLSGSGGFIIRDLDEERLAKWQGTPIRGFGSITTVGELASLSPEELLALTTRLGEHLGGGTEPNYYRGRISVVGVVTENDSLAHILYRQERPGVRAPWEVELITARKSQGRWRLMAQLGPSPALFDDLNERWV